MKPFKNISTKTVKILSFVSILLICALIITEERAVNKAILLLIFTFVYPTLLIAISSIDRLRASNDSMLRDALDGHLSHYVGFDPLYIADMVDEFLGKKILPKDLGDLMDLELKQILYKRLDLRNSVENMFSTGIPEESVLEAMKYYAKNCYEYSVLVRDHSRLAKKVSYDAHNAIKALFTPDNESHWSTFLVNNQERKDIYEYLSEIYGDTKVKHLMRNL